MPQATLVGETGVRACQGMRPGMAMRARRAHHSELLEVLPELRLAAVMGNAPHKDLVGFAAVAPGSFLLSGRRGSATSDRLLPHRLATTQPFPLLYSSFQDSLSMQPALLLSSWQSCYLGLRGAGDNTHQPCTLPLMWPFLVWALFGFCL